MSFTRTRPQKIEPANSSRRAVTRSRAVFFITSARLYTVAIVLATLTLNPYFSQTWDVTTFIHAASSFLTGEPLALYAQSRIADNWPYAYPPLHAFAVAIALSVGKLAPILPDYIWARAPTMVADIGIAILLHHRVVKKSNDETLGRAAVLLWLFNPITFYDTAVQGHFESEWLVFILLAYVWHDESRNLILPTLALALAVLSKQIAILFVLPIWIMMLMDQRPLSSTISRRVLRVLGSGIVFTLVVSVVCLPYLLYSNDFLYMNLTYVENVPVQTQSWIVALLGITRNAPNVLTSDFFLLRYQTIVSILAAIALAFFAARRGSSLYLAATLIAIAFFLTSKKVMGYYYVMLLPFLLAELLPRRRFDLVGVTLVATTWIALSPYYAAWTNHAHWWIYAALGILNSAFFVWLFAQTLAGDGDRTLQLSVAASHVRSTILVSCGLFAGAVGAAILQPFASNNGSPIRAPIIAPGTEWVALAAFSALLALILIALIAVYRATKFLGGSARLATLSVALIFAPLFFSVYYLTKETTAIFEIALKALGV